MTFRKPVRVDRTCRADLDHLNPFPLGIPVVVNSAVAWGEKREHLRLSVFHATVIADADDQPEGALDRTDLQRVPIIVPPEEALPAGTGEPGAQIALPGMEPVADFFEQLLQRVEGDKADYTLPDDIHQAVIEPTPGVTSAVDLKNLLRGILDDMRRK